MTVCDLPELVFDVPMNITIPDFVKVRTFIAKNQRLIKQIADDGLDYSRINFRRISSINEVRRVLTLRDSRSPPKPIGDGSL